MVPNSLYPGTRLQFRKVGRKAQVLLVKTRGSDGDDSYLLICSLSAVGRLIPVDPSAM